jgi:DMSO/TMAO reductase YedYZ molybdopterin-dependent catalytic subunit
MSRLLTRRGVLTGIGYSVIAGGTAGLAFSPAFRDLILGTGEKLAYQSHRLIGRNALAPEFTEAEMSPVFRTNGNTMPASGDYQAHVASGFANWQLQVDGLVAAPKTFSLATLRAMPARTQITRHDCVEGWSAIGKWTGVPLSTLLSQVTLLPAARYLVLHCADDFGGQKYYESIDLVDAFHPQTILAHAMNDQALTVGHGAPLRLRVERQLGYKQAKYVMRVEAVASLDGIGLGKGGYWEDQIGYDWYAGI